MSGITTLEAHSKASATHLGKLIFFRINIMGINIHHVLYQLLSLIKRIPIGMRFVFEVNPKIMLRISELFVIIYINLNILFALANLKIYWFCNAQFHMHEKSADSISHRRKV